MADLRIPPLDDSLFRYADYGTSQVDRTEQRRREYHATAESLLAIYGVDQGDLNHFAQLYAAWLRACGSCISVLVAGPSNFPARRAQKANRSETKRREELDVFVARLRKRARRQKKADEIAEAGGEAAVARAEIEAERRRLSQMKAANKIVRAAPKDTPTPEKLAQLAALGLDGRRGALLFEPDFCGRCGFPAYELTAVRTAIKRREEKLEALAKVEVVGRLADEEITFDGLTVTLAWHEDRLQVRHDEKPAADVRAALKRHGFRWSRYTGAWQRQLTAGGFLNWQAVISAEMALGVELRSEGVVVRAGGRLEGVETSE